MATPKDGYYFNGNRLVGTTTVIGRFGDSGGLKYWCWEQGYKQGKDNKPFKFMDAAKKAADIGTAAHAMIEAHINGDNPDDTLLSLLPQEAADLGNDIEFVQKANNAYEMYLKWERQTKVKMLSKYQEIQLVSPEYKYGGTPDAIGEIDGEIVLLDWKSSNGLYPDMLLQLSAYNHLINEGIRMDTGEPLGLKITGGFHLCRFAKEFPDFGHHYFGSLDYEWEQFKDYLRCYERDKKIKQRAK